MSFVFSFVSCKPFIYLIGSLVVSSVFSILNAIFRGSVNK